MARGNIDNVNALGLSSWPATGLPFSISMWIKMGSYNFERPLNLTHSTTFHEFNLLFTTGPALVAQTRNSISGISSSSGGSTPPTNEWFQVGGIWRSGNAYRNHYVNGSPGTADTTSRTVNTSGPNPSILVGFASSAIQVSDFAVWNADIGDAGMASLGDGFAAHLIRRESLVAYAPLVRTNAELKAGLITETGTVGVQDHPPIIGAIVA